MFVEGLLYKHLCGKDLYMTVTNVSYRGDKYTKMHIMWVSKWTGSVLSTKPEKIKILATDYQYWNIV